MNISEVFLSHFYFFDWEFSLDHYTIFDCIICLLDFFLWILWIFWILIPCQVYSWQDSCHSVGFFFTQLTVALAVLQKHFSFMNSQLLNVGLNSRANGVLLRMPFPTTTSCKELPMFPSSGFSILGFKVRTLVHLDLNVAQDDRYKYNVILLHEHIQFPSTIC